VVITDTKLVAPTERWDLDYLEQNIGNGDFSVFLSRNHKFKYYDDKKIPPASGDSRLDFTPPTRRVDMRFSEFASKLRQWRRGDERQVTHSICFTFCIVNTTDRSYFTLVLCSRKCCTN